MCVGPWVKLRFLADENFSYKILNGLKRHFAEIDVVTSDDVDLRGRPDDEVLSFAAEVGRVLLTHDCKTMPGHFKDRLYSGGSGGVIVLRQQTSIGRAIEIIGTIWEEDDADDWVDMLEWVA